MESEAGNCPQCGFDRHEWNDSDAIGSIQAVGAMLACAAEDLLPGMVTIKIDRRTWSVGQYLQHLLEITGRSGEIVDATLAGTPLARPLRRRRERRGPAPASIDLDAVPAVVDSIRRQLDAIHTQLMAFRPADNGEAMAGGLVTRPTADRSKPTLRDVVDDLLHEFMHHLADVSRIKHELGGLTRLTGRLASINSSADGAPKTPRVTGRIDRGGLIGDIPVKGGDNGRPWQALSLYSAELIDELGGEGHPIEPGSVGENLTLAAINWNELRPGLVVKVGEVRGVLTAPAPPCPMLARSFADGDWNRIDHERHPGWARWYASVLTPGVVATGDQVVISSYRPW